MVGMACGFSFNLYLWLGTKVAFPWYVVMGSIVTFAIGWLASTLIPAKAMLDVGNV